MEWFHLYEAPRIDKFIEKERTEATQDWGKWQWVIV